MGNSIIFVMVGSLVFTNALRYLDSGSANKLVENWTNFAHSLLTPNMSCYKTIADYGTVKVASPADNLCDAKIDRKGMSVCIKVNKGAHQCKASISSQQKTIDIELTVSSIIVRCSKRVCAMHLYSVVPTELHV